MNLKSKWDRWLILLIFLVGILCKNKMHMMSIYREQDALKKKELKKADSTDTQKKTPTPKRGLYILTNTNIYAII